MSTRHTVTIERTIEIDVEVGHQAGQARRWYPPEPDDGDQWWIEKSVDAETQEAVELEPLEIEEAIKKAIRDRRFKEDRHHE